MNSALSILLHTQIAGIQVTPTGDITWSVRNISTAKDMEELTKKGSQSINKVPRSMMRKALITSLNLGDDDENPIYTKEKAEFIEQLLNDLVKNGVVE